MLASDRTSFHCLIAFAVACLFALPVLGQADYWLGSSGGIYEFGGYWSLGAPGAYPTFNLDSSGYTVLFSASGDTATDTVVETDNPTLQFDGGTFTTNNLDVCDAAGTSGSLTLTRGTMDVYPEASQRNPPPLYSSSYLTVGNGSNSAQLIVNGASVLQYLYYEAMTIASGSTLIVENGGSVEQNYDAYQPQMSVANLVANDGTVLSVYTINLGSATISNGSLVSAYYQLTVSGDVAVDNSTLRGGNVSIDGPLSAQLDSTTQGPIIDANGISIGGGSFDLTLADGFTPVAGDEFQLFDDTLEEFGSVSITGTFGNVTLPPLPDGETWDTSQLYAIGVISVVPEPASFGLILAAGALMLRRRGRRGCQPAA